MSEERSDRGTKRSAGVGGLRSALRAVRGCLGVKVAATEDGKEVVFAWFEDKEAVLRWYHSRARQETMRAFFPQYKPRGPLHDVPGDVGPILAIASLKTAEEPLLKALRCRLLKSPLNYAHPSPGASSSAGDSRLRP